ncbi:MAG: carboxymuconolactone decarboxylase [Betaproteobacteria bacterium RBG_16_64_9]|nr:MAG: carboxymuconolactone decarboxylase [Betaproteobacteria bacterium RBG_16_64_9]OGA22358.1 MAG: carboxymuconolactone decarboxylase [Betaproteobacteria bacterium RIFCSPLOWO2_02_FULL_65_24]OGA73975.1 MAG: carboxymuconolactone decarboxylase [Betaproteobacteria bacterium RIFCSPLOWO2_12_FULL_66_14]
MARLSYPDLSAPDIAPLAERIKAERGGRMLNLYRMLLHSPPVADGWRSFLTAIRQQCRVAGRYRELAILRVAVLNGAEYEFNAHVPFALKEGLSQAQLDVMKQDRLPEGLTEADRAVLDYTQAMTRAIRVPDTVFAAVKRHFDEREMVELTATIAAYNLVSRFLVALEVDHE